MIDIGLRVSLSRRPLVTEAPRFRFAWDDELSDYGYKCRTQQSGWSGPDNPPAVIRYYPSAKVSGDYRVDVSAWKNFVITLNGGGDEGLHRWEYWCGSARAQFNSTGWPMLAYVGMEGNEINVLEQVNGWVKFETLRPDDVELVMDLKYSIETRPCYIHRFTCVSWKDGRTVHIESTGTPRGQVYYPLITKQGSAWIPSRFVVEL